MSEALITEQLRDLIASDQQALSLFFVGNDTDCALRCSSISLMKRVVTTDEVQKVASFGGAWAKIAIASQSNDTPPDIRGLAITFREWILRGYGLDFEIPQVQAMTATLVTAGLATQAEVDSLIEMSNSNYTITPADIGTVRQVYGSDLGGE